MPSSRRSPLVETLENRRLLSAVTAAVVDGTLFVGGTPGGDSVSIVRTRDGVTHVAADTAGAASADFAFAPWSFGAVHVDLGGGGDGLEVKNLVAWRGGSILTGDGDDRVLLQNANVNGDLFLDAGEGDDAVTVRNSTLEGASLRLGNGDDALLTQNLTVWNYATLDLGNGDDALAMVRTTVYGWSSLYGGEGRDRLWGDGNRLAGGANVLDFEW